MGKGLYFIKKFAAGHKCKCNPHAEVTCCINLYAKLSVPNTKKIYDSKIYFLKYFNGSDINNGVFQKPNVSKFYFIL